MPRLTQSPADLLTRQFLTWLADAPRPYGLVMDGWRTSCPRLSIWEDALREGYVALDGSGQGQAGMRVRITDEGRAALHS